MSSKKTPKLLVSEKTCPTPKLPPVEKAINPVPKSPANEKASKPKTKLPLTKKSNKIPATGKTDKPSVNRKRPKTRKFRGKMNGAKKIKIHTDFVVRFFSKLTSLKDPDVVKVVDLLSKANDVKVHRYVIKFSVLSLTRYNQKLTLSPNLVEVHAKID